MAKKGTKKVELDGEIVYLPAEDAEIVQLIERGLTLQDRKERAEDELADIKARLVELAEPKRNARATVVLEDPAGRRARVEWHREHAVDATRAELLTAKLEQCGAEAEMVFVRKVSYGLAKNYQQFMRMPSSALLEELKAEIAKAIEVRERKPAVKLIDVAELE